MKPQMISIHRDCVRDAVLAVGTPHVHTPPALDDGIDVAAWYAEKLLDCEVGTK